ncbi:hypothetical protein HPC49_16175 [Pyxidicoccus fallax]|uniref:Carbohydrate kinase PfkB domain-containing protein n=1 Tax=Pyxidicoccus fallax TaxID=394095 RepID=A0A848LJN4_9BACT|nr:PfkB family carbohydrate kinase [Pyxidicoccus fallax]NMO17920.1 hypothetical protein [Pyxidicoccus fallax]NPC79756.1 hypothetical protein [Pyxidicoccus fallax]
MPPGGTSQPVLIIGSTLLDIGAKYSGNPTSTQKLGTVQYSVGGAAFNIAANLHANKFPVALMTYLKEQSIGCDMIRKVLDRSGIGLKHVRASPAVGEPAYVAHFHNGALVSGVTSSLIDAVELEAKELDRAIRRAALVVVETNLSRDQIKSITESCRKHDRPVLAQIVAADKADRICGLDSKETLFEIVSMNREEASRIGFHWPADDTAVREFCQKVSARWVFVTLAENGHVLLRQDGQAEETPSLARGMVNVSGAGDALFAAVCSCMYEGKPPSHPAVRGRINDWVSRVLQRESANLLDVPELSEKERARDMRTAGTFFLLVAGLALTLLAMRTSSDLLFWCALLACSVVFGSIGALVRDTHIFKLKGNPTRSSFVEACLCGGVAGLTAGLFYFMPHLSVGSETGPAPISLDQLQRLFLWMLPVTIGAGLAVDSFLLDLRSRFGRVSERQAD